MSEINIHGVTKTVPVTPKLNGTTTHTTTPTAGAQTQTTPPASGAQDIAAQQARLDAALKDIERKEKGHVLNVRKWSEEKRALEAKAAEADKKLAEIDRQEKLAKLNPIAYLQGKYGDKWYDIVTEAKLNGIPPADLIAAEVEKLRTDFETKLSEKDKAAETAKAEAEKAARTQRVEAARAQLLTETTEFLKASGKEYPALEVLGDESAVSKQLAQAIESEFNNTHKLDNDGRVVSNGRVLTAKEAAEKLEAQLVEVAVKVAAHEKYKGKFQPAPSIGGPKLQRTETQQRRTLSNELSGKTTEAPQRMSREERWERAKQAFNSVHQKAQ